jgi:hypothetical protein
MVTKYGKEVEANTLPHRVDEGRLENTLKTSVDKMLRKSKSLLRGFEFFFSDTVNQTQGLVHARQALFHLSYAPNLILSLNYNFLRLETQK